MKISFCYVGKTNQTFVTEGMNMYFKRLKHYVKLEEWMIPDVKKQGSLSPSQLKSAEAKAILDKISNTDFVVLLDENGKDFTSEKLADWLAKQMVQGARNVVFVVGGAYGFDDSVRQRANLLLRLSSMTFSHQIIRVIFAEQLYRAFTIIKGEPYHNQ